MVRKDCANCMKTDGIVYTSSPPKVRCMVDNSFHERFDTCDSWAGKDESSVFNFPKVPSFVKPEAHWIDAGWDGDYAWQIDGRGNCWHLWKCSHCFTESKKASRFCPECGFEMTEMPEVEE